MGLRTSVKDKNINATPSETNPVWVLVRFIWSNVNIQE